MSRFGERVKKLRKDKNLTVEKVAKAIGSHKGYVSGIENGKVKPPSPKLVRKIARPCLSRWTPIRCLTLLTNMPMLKITIGANDKEQLQEENSSP